MTKLLLPLYNVCSLWAAPASKVIVCCRDHKAPELADYNNRNNNNRTQQPVASNWAEIYVSSLIHELFFVPDVTLYITVLQSSGGNSQFRCSAPAEQNSFVWELKGVLIGDIFLQLVNNRCTCLCNQHFYIQIQVGIPSRCCQ